MIFNLRCIVHYKKWFISKGHRVVRTLLKGGTNMAIGQDYQRQNVGLN